MYSLLFVSFFNWELVKKAEADHEEQEHASEEMIKKFIKEKKEKSLEHKKSLSKLELKTLA